MATTAACAAPLLLTGLTFAICSRAGMFNIGAEGQSLMGVLASTATALALASWPAGPEKGPALWIVEGGEGAPGAPLLEAAWVYLCFP